MRRLGSILHLEVKLQVARPEVHRYHLDVP
jgi:hypothetical protein